MAARRAGTRKPPPRADLLVPEYREAVERFGAEAPLIIGGKSMGGRVASMVVDEIHDAEKAAEGEADERIVRCAACVALPGCDAPEVVLT